MRRYLAQTAVLGCALAGLIAAAGCSSGSGSAESSWAPALGSGVTVQAPAQVSAGTGSPAAAVQGVITAVSSGQYALECNYVEPSEQATCKAGAAAFNASDSPTFKNTKMGYVAIDGAKALALTALDLMCDRSMLDAVKADFEATSDQSRKALGSMLEPAPGDHPHDHAHAGCGCA